MSNKAKMMIETVHGKTHEPAFRKTVADHMMKHGVPDGGATAVVEHGTVALIAEPTAADRVDGVQGYINRLHAERGLMVSKARAVRMEKGVTSPEFAKAWFDVERITRDLDEAEASLGHDEPTPLLRDPETEMPDDGFHVVAVTDDETESVVLAYHDAGSWLEVDGDSVLDGSVVGWCWQDEAASVLKKAVRS